MKVLVKFFRLNLFLAVFFCLGSIVVQAEFKLSAEQLTSLVNLAVENETQAENLSKQWNGTANNRSIVLYLEAASQWKQIADLPKASNSLREAVRLYLLLGDYKSAFIHLDEALKIDEKINSLPDKIETFSLLSKVSLQSGQIQNSKKYMEQALSLSKLIEDPKSKAMALYSAGEFHYNQNNDEKAIKYYEESLVFWRKANYPRGEFQTLISLTYAFATSGNPVKGLEQIIEAKRKAAEIGDIRGQAIAEILIGHINLLTDEKQAALSIYQRADAIFPDDMDFIEKARLQNAIGSIYEDFGQWKISLSYRQKAFELYKKEQYLYGQLATLQSLGRLSHLCADQISAFRYFDEAINLANNLRSTYYLAFTYKELGDLFTRNNADNQAVTYYQKALSTFQKLNAQRPISLIQINLGNIYEKQGDFFLARQSYDAALKTNREIKNKFAESETLFHLARLDILENKDQNAIDLAKKSIEITELLTSDVFNSKLKSTYFSNVFDRYELYINLLMKMHRQTSNENYAIQALQAAEKSRARSMLENLSLSEANFTKDADAETVKREKEIRVLLNAKADKLTDLLSQNADQAEIEKISTEINELEHELEEIRANLKQLSPIYSAIKNPAPFDVGEFQKQILDENTLFLEFSFGKEESYLWLIGKTEVNSYILPPREQIEAKIQTLRELLASREMKKDEEIETYQARVVKAENDYWQIAGQLSSELFGQVSDKFEKKRLIIVPDGKLNYFPVSALPLPNVETGEPILLSNEIIYEPSASTLSILSKIQNQSAVASKNLLVFSDPVFTKDDSRISPETKAEENLAAESQPLESFRFAESLNSLVRLEASKTEADSIIDVLGTAKADNYSGFSANRERLLNTNVADYKIIHFATHGLINEERPELSGIVLSRFGENGQKLDEFVRLQDIYGMNLNSDLVVLSACETGIGKEVRGEGLMSLNNAFLQVGAKSVMSSLWKVEDNATLELMKNFYESLANENITPSKALQNAQIKMWQSGRYKSPFYWAAFTVQGDYKRAPNLSRDFSYTILFSVIGLAVLLFGIFWLYRFRRGKSLLLNRK